MCASDEQHFGKLSVPVGMLGLACRQVCFAVSDSCRHDSSRGDLYCACGLQSSLLGPVPPTAPNSYLYCACVASTNSFQPALTAPEPRAGLKPRVAPRERGCQNCFPAHFGRLPRPVVPPCNNPAWHVGFVCPKTVRARILRTQDHELGFASPTPTFQFQPRVAPFPPRSRPPLPKPTRAGGLVAKFSARTAKVVSTVATNRPD